MSWARDVLFVGLILGGIGALWTSLSPTQTPEGSAIFEPHRPEFTRTVGELNHAFHNHWTDEGYQPAGRASDLAIIRRLSLALVGSIPSVQEIRQFEAYQGEERIQWYLAKLLDDRRFGDYFAERLARTYVGTEEGPFLIFRRRRFVTWLSDQIMANRSYGEIVTDLIAGDGLWTDQPGTNFLTAAFVPGADDASPAGPDPEKVAGKVARAFLGIRLDCAQCHDHPFEYWKQNDFQGLAAFFGGTRLGFTGFYDDEDGVYKYEDRTTTKRVPIEPRVPFAQEIMEDSGDRRRQLASWVTHAKNPYFAQAAVQRIWALMFGKPMLDSVESMMAVDDPPPYLKILARDFTEHHYDLRRLIQVIAGSDVFHLDSFHQDDVDDSHEFAWAVYPMTRLRPEQVSGSVLQSTSLQTINYESNLFIRIARDQGVSAFVRRYGDTGEDEFADRAVTIPQALLLMNGNLVKQSTQAGIFSASQQIATMAPDDKTAVEVAFLAVLTRRPTPAESKQFQKYLAGRLDLNADGVKKRELPNRSQRLEDMYWNLINCTEFSWNH